MRLQSSTNGLAMLAAPLRWRRLQGDQPKAATGYFGQRNATTAADPPLGNMMSPLWACDELATRLHGTVDGPAASACAAAGVCGSARAEIPTKFCKLTGKEDAASAEEEMNHWNLV